MTWVRLDDEFAEHPKIAQLTDSAFALFVTGLCYCNRNLTDGFIPNMVGLGQLRWCDGNAIPPIRELERGGLWERIEGGWMVHDYPNYQPSREKMLQTRASRVEAGKLGGKRSGEARRSKAEAKAKQNTNPVPEPIVVEAKASTRPRDELWDSLAVEVGSQPETKSERGRWNHAVKQLRDANATPDDVASRAREYHKRWPQASLTPTALAAHWGELAPPAKRLAALPCPDCGVGGGQHLADCPTVMVAS